MYGTENEALKCEELGNPGKPKFQAGDTFVRKIWGGTATITVIESYVHLWVKLRRHHLIYYRVTARIVSSVGIFSKTQSLSQATLEKYEKV